MLQIRHEGMRAVCSLNSLCPRRGFFLLIKVGHLRMNPRAETEGKFRLDVRAVVLKLSIRGNCTDKHCHAFGAHDLHLGTGDDHLIGGKRSGVPELALDSDETLR